jgi:hypothetical protein
MSLNSSHPVVVGKSRQTFFVQKIKKFLSYFNQKNTPPTPLKHPLTNPSTQNTIKYPNSRNQTGLDLSFSIYICSFR